MANPAEITLAALVLLHRALRHRKVLLASVGACLILAIVSSCLSTYSNDLSALFPHQSEVFRAYSLLNRSGLTSKVQIEFDCSGAGGLAKAESDLDRIAQRLREIPSVTNFQFRFEGIVGPNGYLTDYARFLPALLSPEQFWGVADPEKAVSDGLIALVRPVPGGVAFARSDPFQQRRQLLKSLTELSELGGLSLSSGHNYMASQDDTRAVMFFDLPVAVGEAQLVRPALTAVQDVLRALPSGITAKVISGHLHTLGNEKVLRRDITIVSLGSVFLLILLFVILYRGAWRVLFIPLVPAVSFVIMNGILARCVSSLCMFMIGIGCGIVGLAVDQGIHVYTAFSGKDAEIRTAELSIGLLLGCGTSVLVFLLLCLTGIPAYIQLGVFAAGALMTSLVLSFFVLPGMLDRNRPSAPFQLTIPKPGRIWKYAVRILLPSLSIYLIGGLLHLQGRFHFQMQDLDGTPREILQQEQDFREYWRKSGEDGKPIPQPALVLLEATSAEELDQEAERWRKILSEQSIRSFSHTDIWPSQHTIQERVAEWRNPQTQERLAQLEQAVRDHCRKRQLPLTFFEPFFTSLRQGIRDSALPSPAFARQIGANFVRQVDGRNYGMIIFEDTPANVSTMLDVRQSMAKRQNSAVISLAAFTQMLRNDLGGRLGRVQALALILIPLLLLLLQRSIRKMLMSLIPALTALMTTLVTVSLAGMSIKNPVVVLSAVLLSGLAIDYGIFAVEYLNANGRKRSIPNAMVLSATTTVASTAMLLCSAHPVLFATGLVLAPGICVACLTAFLIVPAFQDS